MATIEELRVKGFAMPNVEYDKCFFCEKKSLIKLLKNAKRKGGKVATK